MMQILWPLQTYSVRHLFLCSISILIFLICSLSHAAYVSNVDGKNLTLELMGDPAPRTGEIQNIYNSENIKVGIIKIVSVSGHIGRGVLVRGNAEIGDTVKRENSTHPLDSPAPSQETGQKSFPNGKPSGGASLSGKSIMIAGPPLKGMLLGYNIQKFSIESVSLDGSGPQVGLFGEKRLNDKLKLRGTLSYFKLDLHDSENLGLRLSVDYLAAQLGFNYFWSRNYWSGIQLGYFVPNKKDSNIITANGLAAANVVSIEAGSLINLSSEKFIPLILSYNLFVNSPGVNASYAAVQIGYATLF